MNFAIEPTQNEFFSEANYHISDTAWDLLKGAIDIHVHSNPTMGDGFVLDDFELVREYEDHGLKGVCIKCHEFGTFFRAKIAQKYAVQGDDFKVYGSLVLNEHVGGLNPVAVESAINSGAKLVFFPTFCAQNQIDIWTGTECYPFYSPEVVGMTLKTFSSNGIHLLDEEGKVKPEVVEILALVRDADIAIASGHVSNRESYEVFKVAKNMGVRKMVHQHIDWRTSEMSIGMQREMAKLGVKLEKSFYEFDADRSLKSFAQAAGTKPSDYVMSSDQGMFPELRALRGFACNVQEHLNGGVPAADLKVMLQDVPEFLMEG